MFLSRAFLIGGVGALIVAAWFAGVASAWSDSTLPAVRLSTQDGPAVLVVFQPGDCSTYRGFIEQWGELNSRSEIRVVGAVVNVSDAFHSNGQPQIEFTPAYPVRFDLEQTATRMLRRAGYHETPVAILLDAEGRPRMIISPHPNPRRQAVMRELVREYAVTLPRS